MIPAIIASIIQATPTIKTLRLIPKGIFSFKAGQWLDFYINIEGERRVAGYSMTSSPLEKEFFDLAVKNVGENPITQYIHSKACEGETVYVDGGHGEVYYERGMAKSIVLIAGGIGIAPHMSIFRYIDQSDPDCSASLLYSAVSRHELLFMNEINSITNRNQRMTCLATITEDPRGWKGRTGKIDIELISELGFKDETLYYICGPPLMIHGIVDALRRLGVKQENILYELWG